MAVLIVALIGMLVLYPARTRAQGVERIEVGGEYTFVKGNAPPGECGCLQLNGGTGWLAYNFSSHFALAGEVGGEHGSNINNTAAELTLTSFLAGPRYKRRVGSRLAPFVQVLADRRCTRERGIERLLASRETQ